MFLVSLSSFLSSNEALSFSRSDIFAFWSVVSHKNNEELDNNKTSEKKRSFVQNSELKEN